MTCISSFRPKQRSGPFFQVFRRSINFLYCKTVFHVVNASLRWLYNVSCLFLSFLLITSGVQLCIDESGLACCLYCTKNSYWRKIYTILQPMGRKGRYLKKCPKLCCPIRCKETQTKRAPTTLLSQRKLPLTARNTVLYYKIICAAKNFKNGPVPYLSLELTKQAITSHIHLMRQSFKN